ncbi:MAG: hypothetical protein ABIP75_09700 [Pyrinomonadaceae bacterium]
MDRPHQTDQDPDEKPAEPEQDGPEAGGDSGYYYDDATGYEVYDPEADDDPDDETPADRVK